MNFLRWKPNQGLKQRLNGKAARAEFGANTCPTAGEHFSFAPLLRVNIRDFSQSTSQMATGAISISHFLLNCTRTAGINRVLLSHWSKRRLDRATYFFSLTHLPLLRSNFDHLGGTTLTRHSFLMCGLIIVNLKHTNRSLKKSLVLSEPSVFYRYFYKLRSRGKLVSPRWPP